MGNHHRNREFSHEKWWIFPISFLVNVYQAGYVRRLQLLMVFGTNGGDEVLR
jgi:hypothetical protein